MRFKMVESLREAMHVRVLRNTCRLELTNSRNHIGVLRQIRWYFKEYLNQKKAENYRLYLLYDEQNIPLGYGALALRNRKLFITECVGPAYRECGHGLVILQKLIQIGAEEKRDLIAEIWATNAPSLALHKKAGFELESRTTKDGKELLRYLLSFDKL
jgi:RimJ/RimL family protein N-acetyltransferase